jgi:hypothetical protein
MKPSHRDERASYPDEKLFHRDERACHPDEKPSHRNERACHPDEKPRRKCPKPWDNHKLSKEKII